MVKNVLHIKKDPIKIFIQHIFVMYIIVLYFQYTITKTVTSVMKTKLKSFISMIIFINLAIRVI